MGIDSLLHERLLAKLKTRDRFESDLRTEFGHEPAFEASLARLRAQKLVDDRRAAESLIRAKSPASRAMLETLLNEKGVDADAFLADHDELAAAREIVAKRSKDPKAKVARYLAAKGFASETIEEALDLHGDE